MVYNGLDVRVKYNFDVSTQVELQDGRGKTQSRYTCLILRSHI